jgi:hypothetical protein
MEKLYYYLIFILQLSFRIVEGHYICHHKGVLYEECISKFYWDTMITTAADSKNWLQVSRYSNRGSIYLFAPMINFNVMAEVGDTPP